MEILSSRSAQVVSTPTGTLKFWRPGRGILVTQISGVLTDGMASVLEAVGRRLHAEDGRATSFHDWEELIDYEAASRVRLTELMRQLLASSDGTNVLVRARMIVLAVDAARVASPQLRVYEDRAAFEVALRDTLITRGAA
jgi:hypothetical protein